MTDQTHDPALQSWVHSANLPSSDFPIQNLPFGTFQTKHKTSHVGVAIGDEILDITTAFGIPDLLSIMQETATARRDLRGRISGYLSKHSPGAEQHLVPIRDAELLLPCPIGNYTDFYASIDHATNVGSMFRPENPLLPNYKWIPIAYHGRASSIVPSGASVRRPRGQITNQPAGPPRFAPTERLDYELELGAFLGPGSALGEPIPIDQAEDHLVGMCLLNDWSARDIQTWEYQPLGPFLAKNFATTISPWIVTREALEPFRAVQQDRPQTDPPPLPYLQSQTPAAFHITLEVSLRTASMDKPVVLSQSDFASMYWTWAQMIAHHSSNGCPLRPGDLIGSGTVSGPEKRNRGCLLELTWRGTEPLTLPNGEIRHFLQDGDEVAFHGWCEAPGFRRIGFGICAGVITPALDP